MKLSIVRVIVFFCDFYWRGKRLGTKDGRYRYEERRSPDLRNQVARKRRALRQP